MQIPESMQVTLSLEDDNIPEVFKEFNPVVYQEGNSFCVLLGENPQSGIFGYGKTTALAVADWVNRFNQRMVEHKKGDELVNFVRKMRKENKDEK